MILNELSLYPAALHINTARERMMRLMEVAKAATETGHPQVIQVPVEFGATTLAPNYVIAQWINDSAVVLEIRQYLLSLTTKLTYSSTEMLGYDEFSIDGNNCLGLGIAYQRDDLAVSINSQPIWDTDQLTINRTFMDADAVLLHEDVRVRNVSQLNHIDTHREWITCRARQQLIDAVDLWKDRATLLPNLVLCGTVESQLRSFVHGDPSLTQVKIKLFELNRYAADWHTGEFDIRVLPFKISPESETRREELKDELTIECPDGMSRNFDLHCRYTPGAGRLYLLPDGESRKLFVGYVGKKLGI